VTESLKTTCGECGLFVAARLAQPSCDVLMAPHHRYAQRRTAYIVPGIDICFIGQQQLPGIYYDRSR